MENLIAEFGAPEECLPPEAGQTDESLSILSLIHTRTEHKLYEFMFTETRRAKTRFGVFTNKYLLRSGIDNFSSIRRSSEGLISKLSIEKSVCATGSSKDYKFYYTVYSPAEVLARRAAEKLDLQARKRRLLEESESEQSLALIARICGRYNLSRREADVLRLCSEGLTNPEIGDELFVQEETIKFHMRNIFMKTRVNRRSKLIALVLREKF